MEGNHQRENEPNIEVTTQIPSSFVALVDPEEGTALKFIPLKKSMERYVQT